MGVLRYAIKKKAARFAGGFKGILLVPDLE